MKNWILFLLGFLGANAHTIEIREGQRQFVASIICEARGNLFSTAGESIKDNYVDSTLYLELVKIDGLLTAESYGGHASLYRDTAVRTGKPDMYAVFKGENLASNPVYKGRRYTNHFQIPGLNDAASFVQETGWWGNLVIHNLASERPETTEGVNFDAHYIFQAGDHVGGTIHYTCQFD